jgi:hypothetical protein
LIIDNIYSVRIVQIDRIFFMGDIAKVGEAGEVQGKQQQRSTRASEFERL